MAIVVFPEPEIPVWVQKVFHRLRKRVFANDPMSLKKRDDGCYEIALRRRFKDGKDYEVCLILAPYHNVPLGQLELESDKALRSMLRHLKEEHG